MARKSIRSYIAYAEEHKKVIEQLDRFARRIPQEVLEANCCARCRSSLRQRVRDSDWERRRARVIARRGLRYRAWQHRPVANRCPIEVTVYASNENRIGSPRRDAPQQCAAADMPQRVRQSRPVPSS